MSKILYVSAAVAAIFASTAFASAQDQRGQLPESYYGYGLAGPNEAAQTGPWAPPPGMIQHPQRLGVTVPPGREARFRLSKAKKLIRLIPSSVRRRHRVRMRASCGRNECCCGSMSRRFVPYRARLVCHRFVCQLPQK